MQGDWSPKEDGPLLVGRMAQDVPTFDWLLNRLLGNRPGLEVDDTLAVKSAAFIWDNIHRSLDVPSIVRRVPATRRTMERRFRSQFGRSIRQVVAFARLELAKWLLARSELPIHRVAQHAGYSSSDWMGKVVRRETGMTPSEYRRRSERNEKCVNDQWHSTGK
jgi:transcriptional regulator GlxA family with amidase domain